MTIRTVALTMLTCLALTSFALAQPIKMPMTPEKKEIAYEMFLKSGVTVRVGEWLVIEKKPVAIAINIPSEGTTYATIMISCLADEVQMDLLFDDSLDGTVESNSLIGIEYKIDDNKIVSEHWKRQSDGNVISKLKPANFIEQLMNAKRMGIRLNKRLNMEAAYELEGMTEAMVPIQRNCGWR